MTTKSTQTKLSVQMTVLASVVAGPPYSGRQVLKFFVAQPNHHILKLILDSTQAVFTRVYRAVTWMNMDDMDALYGWHCTNRQISARISL
jgi:hypothetical protein